MYDEHKHVHHLLRGLSSYMCAAAAIHVSAAALLVAGAGSARSSEDDGQEDVLEGEMAGGYSAAYAKLANASVPERPVLAEIADPKQFAESRLASFISRMGSS